MKITTNHLSALNNLQKMPLVPKNAKVVIRGAPNVGKNMFAHRLAIDLGVPAISMKNLFKSKQYIKLKPAFYEIILPLPFEFFKTIK